jgi:Poly(ADP-ribose) polymerase, regulatory domain
MNLGEKKEEKDEPADSNEFGPSKLDAQVNDFVKLIFNKTLMEQAVAANGYDVKKLPLGDLSSETI